ncbi:MAG: NAD-dependent epimerase/dehydratase family protein [Verrucomicrobiota bacterium]
MLHRHPIVEEDLHQIAAAQLDWTRFRGKTILITGASGFLPAYMVETLLFLNETAACGCKVIGIVRNMAKAQARFALYAGRRDLCLVKGDVSEPIPAIERCDFIIHAASQASPKFYGTDPVGTMTANLLGSYHLLNLAREWQSEGFLYFSSGEVYGRGEPANLAMNEGAYGYIDILNSRSCYAESKRAAETLAVSYFKQFGVPCTIVRPFHSYGPGMALDDGRVFADFVNDIVHRRDIVLHSDGKAVRAFCYLSDAVLGFFTVLLKGKIGQAYNVGNPAGTMSVGELAEMLVGLFPELHLQVQRADIPVEGYLPSPVSISVPNVDLLSSLGWEQKYLPPEGFRRSVRYFMER